MTGTEESRNVGRCRASDERAVRVRRQAQEVHEPLASYLLDETADGGKNAHVRVLVPGRRYPLRTQGHRQRPAGDEAKEPRAGTHHGRSSTDTVEQIDDVESRLSAFRNSATQALELGDRLGICIDTPSWTRGQILEGSDHREPKSLGSLR